MPRPYARWSRRRFLALGAGGAVLAASAAEASPSTPPSTSPLRIQRLSWAGIRIETGSISLVVDAWTSAGIWDGAWKGAVVPLEASTRRRFALVTHAHNDHFDPAALRQLFGEGGTVVCHEDVAEYVASRGLRVRTARLWEPILLDTLTVTPVPAVDGLGDPQVSWVVLSDRVRLIHAGDTLWHGAWTRIGRQFGPFDAAFLPINAARILDVSPQTGMPISMNPEQAAAAASVLRARLAVPIHYGFSAPGAYEETENPEARFVTALGARRVGVRLLAPGEWLEL